MVVDLGVPALALQESRVEHRTNPATQETLAAWLAEYKRDAGGCRRCDATDARTIDFHHPGPEEKERAVNEMVTLGYSKADVRTEVEKCTLLRANYHAKEHYVDAPPSGPDATKVERLQAWTRGYKRERGCQRCSEEDPRCLQFHHVDGKRECRPAHLR